MEASLSLEKICQGIEFFQQKTRKQCEFVITRFQEDLEWTKNIRHLCRIYNKGQPIDISGAVIHSVPNNGVGLETVFRHIIENYDNLAEVTMFCQGSIADREDQAIYPFWWYFDGTKTRDIKAKTVSEFYSASWTFLDRNETQRVAIKGRTFGEFRKDIIGISLNQHSCEWVKGDWIAVGKDKIRNKPKAYYEFVYKHCGFERGIFLEECYFLERSLYAIFTKPLDKGFKYNF